jgi:hypothetical protein
MMAVIVMMMEQREGASHDPTSRVTTFTPKYLGKEQSPGSFEARAPQVDVGILQRPGCKMT